MSFARPSTELIDVVNDHAKEVGARRVKYGSRLNLQLLMSAIEPLAENSDEDGVRRLINWYVRITSKQERLRHAG